MKNTIAFSLLCCNLAFIPLTAQQMTAFEKVGQGEESVQEFFPGEHRARPVMGSYTDSERMGLFSGGQDLGGSSGWYTDTRWGDLGDGTFANPVLNGDYSDQILHDVLGVPLHGHEHPGIRRHGELENHRPNLRPDGPGRLLGHGQIRQWQLGTGLALPRRQILALSAASN